LKFWGLDHPGEIGKPGKQENFLPMSNPFVIFISGISGVFIGMSLLYFTVKMTSLITDKIEAGREDKK